MYSCGQKFQNYFELQIFLLSHRCLGVSYPLPIIASLCHEWITLPMKSLAALCSVSTAGFLRFLKHPVQVSVLQLRRLIKGRFPNHRALLCQSAALFHCLQYPLISIYVQSASHFFSFLKFCRLSPLNLFQPYFYFFKFAFYHHTNQSFPFLFCSLQFS